MSERGIGGGDFSSDAERALDDRLEEVREPPLTASMELVPLVTRTLRWQSLLRVPLHALGAVAGGILGGLRLLGRRRSA